MDRRRAADRFSIAFLGESVAARADARSVALPLHALAHCLAVPPNGFRLLAHALLRRFFIRTSPLHFAEKSLALHLLLEDAKRLFDIVVTNEYLHD